MIKKSTYTRAYEACEAFFAETGQMPTIDAIKPLIGVNSPSTISSAIKAWKNGYQLKPGRLSSYRATK
jgi:Plasmid replication region DNA-binding N-term